jgi:hypothetical protein
MSYLGPYPLFPSFSSVQFKELLELCLVINFHEAKLVDGPLEQITQPDNPAWGKPMNSQKGTKQTKFNV